MRRFLVVSLILLFVGLGLTGDATVRDAHSKYSIAQSSSGGPTIDWYDIPENGSLVFCWDGIYDGQTEETWQFSRWVNDTDGVDVVVFRFRWFSEQGDWNITATLVEGNETCGLYEANFTYAVWWNWETGTPETEGGGGNFDFKIWANDTLGNWSEVEPIRYSGGYFLVYPPAGHMLLRTPIGWTIIGAVLITTTVIFLVYRRRRNQ